MAPARLLHTEQITSPDLTWGDISSKEDAPLTADTRVDTGSAYIIGLTLSRLSVLTESHIYSSY